jgi:hypothetical protein
MSLHQAYYTSCKTGWGGEGFQFNALSPGLDRGLLGRLVDLCQYEPQPSQPPVPREEELASFPVNFFYQLLTDGRAALGREVYVGKGFDGRFGNFFAHLLVADSARHDFAGLRPIEFWKSPTWVRTPSEKRDLAEPELPVRREQILDPDDLDQFFRTGGREACLPAFFTAVESALATGRRIVLVEPESEGVARWIALATLILPPALVLRFSFCTYHKNPERSGALLVGTTADSQFQFAPQQIRFQYYVLDFVKGRFSPAPATSPFGAALQAAWQKGGMRALGKFSGRLAALMPEVDPADLSDLSLLAGGNLGTLGEGDRPQKFLRWCMRFAPEQWNAPDDLAKLFREAVRGSTARDEIVAQAIEVCRAVTARYPAHGKTAAHFQAAFEEWVASEACQQASTASLADLALILADHAGTPSGLPPDRWRAALEHSAPRDPARSVALLKIGEALGWLGTADLPRAALAASAPALAALDEVRALLLDGNASPLREVLLTACADCLGQLPAHQRESPGLAMLLQNPQGIDTLAELAARRGDFPLVCRVHLAAGESGDRVELLRACLGEISPRHPRAPLPGALAPVDFAFTLIWGTAVPTIEEAVGILKLAATPGSGLPSPAQKSAALAACGRALEAELARKPDRCVPETAEWQERVAAGLEGLGVRFPAARALAVRAEARRLPLVRPAAAAGLARLADTKSPAVVQEALTLSTSADLPLTLQEEMRTLAAQGLVSIHSPQGHRSILELVAAQRAAARESFFASYTNAARTALESSPAPAWLAALLFTVWHPLEYSPAAGQAGSGLWASLRRLLPNAERARAARLRKVASRLKRDALQRALLHWDSASRGKVRNQLATASLQAAWELWEREHCPPGFRGWFLRRVDRLKRRQPVKTWPVHLGTDQ